MSQVNRKNKKSFNQRHDQRESDHNRQLAGYLGVNARNKKPGRKGNNCGQNGKNDGARHAHRTGHSRLLTA